MSRDCARGGTIRNPLTQRDQGKKEYSGPYVLDHGRPYFHSRELSGEYGGFPHRELERRDREGGERRGWTERLGATLQIPIKDRIPTARREATKTLRPVTNQDPASSRMLCGANFRRSDLRSGFVYRCPITRAAETRFASR